MIKSLEAISLKLSIARTSVPAKFQRAKVVSKARNTFNRN